MIKAAAEVPATGTVATTSRVFHALGDEIRLQILDLLREGERCVCELADALETGQSRLSFHLKILKDAGILRDRRQGRWIYYAINPEAVARIERFLSGFRQVRRREAMVWIESVGG